MTKLQTENVTRRSFLIGSAGLTIGVYLTGCEGETTVANPQAATDGVPLEWQPQAYVRIGTDNVVTILAKHMEMGQGIHTGLATLIADEMDADWGRIRVEAAPANVDLYANLEFGSQLTGGSNAISNSYEQMRQVGAAARHMLVQAAATQWDVAAAEIEIERGVVSHAASGQRASFGDLAEAAARQPVPESVVLKTPGQFRLIGKDLARTDIPEKTDGTALYTQDVRLPDMVVAMVERPPRYGGEVKSFDATASKAIDGVIDVVEVPAGVAVAATDFWTASKAREALTIEWDESDAFQFSSDELMAEYREIAKQGGADVAVESGEPDAAAERGEQLVESQYELPYLAHACLEPLSCVVQISDGGCEIWSGAQSISTPQRLVAEALGIEREAVRIHTLYAGGSFGRRTIADLTLAAVQIAQALDTTAPVKLVWTREDDMQGWQYRPLNFHRFSGGLDADGHLSTWKHRVVCQSIGEQLSPGFIVDGIDSLTASGADNILYDIPHKRVDFHTPDHPLPVLWLRGTAETHTVFAVEAFVDALAVAAGRDPVEFRREMLGRQDRMRQVLDLAAEKADWRSPLPAGRGRGVAMCFARATYIAQVAEVTVRDDNSFSVDRVITAIDCGVAVNPDNLRAQIEGGTGYGLSSALGDIITLRDGYVEQRNFDKYRVLRINQMPEVETHIVASTEAPGGIGELSSMTISPAVVNAIHDATGRRIHRLPIELA